MTHQAAYLVTGNPVVFEERREGPPQCMEGVPDSLPIARIEAGTDARSDQVLAECLGRCRKPVESELALEDRVVG